MASGSRSCDVLVWDVPTCAVVGRNHINQNVVTSMKWIKDSKLFLQASEDKALRVWNAENLSVPTITFPLQQFIHVRASCLAALRRPNGCSPSLYTCDRRPAAMLLRTETTSSLGATASTAMAAA
jgi:WD40 repeat protein